LAPLFVLRLTGLTALLKRSFTTLCFRKTEVIDAAANCTAMVHLPGKRALSCAMENAAAMRGDAMSDNAHEITAQLG
jgi:hypothetical protein